MYGNSLFDRRICDTWPTIPPLRNQAATRTTPPPKRQRGGLGKEVRLAFDAGGRKARLEASARFSGNAGVIVAGNLERAWDQHPAASN